MTAAQRGRLAELICFVALIYPEPRTFDTTEEFAKFHHDDIPGLGAEEIDDERLLARLARALSPQPSSWLRERIVKLDAEASRRRQPPLKMRR